MAEPSQEANESPISAAYRHAGKLTAHLALKNDESAIREAESVVRALLEHVKGATEDFEDFVRRVERSEEFALHDSAQVAKTERELKNYYVRARGLEDAVREARDRTLRRR